MRFSLFVLLSFFSLAAVASELRIMAWNVYMLPPPVIFSKQKERTRLQIKALTELSAKYDVLVLTETFQSRYKKHLLKELKDFYPHHIVQKRKGGILNRKFMSSGVMILSKYPFTFLGQVYFNKCAIADCFASKGALLIEVELEHNTKVQILGTHMQANSKVSKASVRVSQLKQIRSLLDQFKVEGVPQIVAGDLNIDSRQGSEFDEMLTTLNLLPLADAMRMANTIAEKVDCFGKEYSGHPENLDHILLRENNSGARLAEESVLMIRDLFSSKEECDLSDHHPVQSLLIFAKRSPASQAKKTFRSPLMLPHYF